MHDPTGRNVRMVRQITARMSGVCGAVMVGFLCKQWKASGTMENDTQRTQFL